MNQNQTDIGSGTLILSFLTGLAAGVAVALLIDQRKDRTLGAEEYEDELFI